MVSGSGVMVKIVLACSPQVYPARGSVGSTLSIIELTRVVSVATGGAILSKESYDYDFDKIGNWTKMTTSQTNPKTDETEDYAKT